MRQMGVRRLDAKKASHSRPAQASRPVKAPPASPSRAPSSTDDARTQHEAELLREIAALKQVNQRLKEEADEARSSAGQATMALQAIQESVDEGGGVVLRAFQEWGVGERNQLITWLEGISKTPRLSEFFSLLKVGHSGLLSKLLDETVLAHCGEERCQIPAGMVSIPSPREECELCGGVEVEAWGTLLSEALLLSGHRKVVFRGRRVSLLRHLARNIDSRISVQVVPLTVNFPADDSAVWVALWRRSGEEAGLVEADCRVKAASLGQWAQRVIYRLEED